MLKVEKILHIYSMKKMKKKYLFTLLACFLFVEASLAAQPFRTEPFSDKIKTLRVNVVDNWDLPPVIELEGGQYIEVSFDELGAQPERYTYTLTHCNADWTPSQLIAAEYMSGFQYQTINDYAVSFNTTMEYVNYRMYFPNEDLTMKVSGNYVVRVYPENDQQHPILSACFSVVEHQTNIGMQVSPRTDMGVNRTYQQVSFHVNYTDNRISPMQDLKVYVLQNNRRDNWGALKNPLNIQANKLIYDHNPQLIFEAGNEYRRFEMTSFKYNGLNIAGIQFHAPYYHIDLRPDVIRSNKGYSYDQDIDGKYLIRTQDGIEYDTEADYFFAHFYLPCEQPFPEDIYLLSEIFNNIADQRSQMEYSAADKGYIKTVLLKQGHYNYMYVTKKSGTSVLNTALIEGNFYQTENEYEVYVYCRPMGARYDQLIGFQQLKSSVF